MAACRCINAILTSLLTAGFSFSTYAGAWTQEAGHGQVIVSALAYRTETRFDDLGSKQDQPRYIKNELNPYFEYGLNNHITLGGSTFLTQADDSTDNRQAVGDTELFARCRLWHNEHYVVSIQPMVKLPSPMGNADDRPAIGSRSADVGVSLLAGRNFRLFGRTHYADASTGYRYRFGASEDQLHVASTVGFNVMDGLTIMPQVFQTIRLQSGAGTVGFTQSPRDDYNLTRLQLSALYALNERDSVQVGGFYHAAGDNVGAGGGVMVAYWRRF